MKRITLLLALVGSALSVWSQLSGETNPTQGTQYTYTFDNGSGQLGGVSWTATNGTVHGTSSSGTAYSAVISFSSIGSETVTAKNGVSNNTLATLSVTVASSLDPGTIGSPQTLCYNEDVAAFSSSAPASGGNGSYSYQWQYSDNGSTNWLDVGGANSETYDPGTLTADRWYRRAVSSGGLTEYSDTLKVTVHSQISAASMNTQTICYNTVPSTLGTAVTGGGGSYTYQWEVRPEGGPWFTLIGETNETYTPDSLTTSKEYRRTVTSACNETITQEVLITVLSPLASPVISSSQVVCYNAAVQPLVMGNIQLGSDSTTYDYQWQKFQAHDTSWVDIAGANSDSYTPSNLTSTTVYRLKISSCSTEEVHSNKVSITVLRELGFAGYITGPTHVDTTTIDSLTFGDGTTTVDWFSSSDGATWTALGSGTTHRLDTLSDDTWFRAEVTNNQCASTSDPFLVQVLPGISADILPNNYVKSQTLLVEEADDQNISSLGTSQLATTYVYFDGLGRSVQQVSKSSTPLGNDVVSFATYDPLGLQQTQYLPYVSMAGTDYIDTVMAAQQAFYESPTANVTVNLDPYAISAYEASPRKLLLEQGAPGSDWQPGSGHTVRYSYRLNTTGDGVKKYDVTDVSEESYDSLVLNRTEVTDENGHRVITYTDARGLTVLKQVEQKANEYASTVNVYDEVGKLRFVLPPKALVYKANNPSADVATLRDQEDLIFEYRYDAKGRLIERKVPGKGWEYLVYDPLDRVALTQDAIMRTQNQWSFAKTDRLGRTVCSGLYTAANTRSELQAHYDTLDYEGGTDDFYEARGTALEGYTNTMFPTQSIELHTVNYYDDYDFNRDSTADYTFDPSHLTGQDTLTREITHMLPVGSKTRILGTNDWLVTVNFYNDDGQVTQVLSNNHNRLTVDNRTTMIYAEFTSEVTYSRSTIITAIDTVEQDQRFTYGPRKRLTKTEHSLDRGTSWETLNALNYNEVGQLSEKNIGNNLQSIDYSYHERGWLESINDPDLSMGDGDVFGMKLVYNTNDSDLNNTQQYNGNISAIKWSAYETSGSDVTEHGYAYTYDHADRLTAADHHQKSSSWGVSSGYDVTGTQYDTNGNLLGMIRNSASGDHLDSLKYEYAGNQLLWVRDGATDSLGFTDRNTTGDDYAYDVNGNLIKDLNKGIDTIYYNHLDLPTKIVLSHPEPVEGDEADSLTYSYSAVGSKLGMNAWKNGATFSSANYVKGLRYENGSLKSIAHTEGRIISKEEWVEVFARDGSTTTGFSANDDVSITSDGSRVKVTSNRNGGTPGAYLLSSPINVVPGETYSLEVLGYVESSPEAAIYIYSVQEGWISWMEVDLPIGAANETLVSKTFTVPSSTSRVLFGILMYNGVSIGDAFYVNEAKLTRKQNEGVFDYQYFLNDHQGNTRRVLSSTAEVYETTATMESENRGEEEEVFINLPAPRVVRTPANETAGGNEAARLNSLSPIGPSIVLKVDKGDTLSLSAHAYYDGGSGYSNALSAAAIETALQSTFNSAAGLGEFTTSVVDNSIGAAISMIGVSGSGDDNVPAAYLNYILFDDTLGFVYAGWTQISSNAQGARELIALNDKVIDQSGYVLAYVSNESNTSNYVYFDDFTVRHAKTNVVQAIDYYPFGMEAMTYTRTAADPTKYLYNAGAEKNDLTGYYETFYRNYDANIGRFTGVDIAAAKYSAVSPYNYAFNNPVLLNDPLGDDPENGCGCPQPSWDHKMDWGGAMFMGEFSITGLFARGTLWSINSGSLFNGGLVNYGRANEVLDRAHAIRAFNSGKSEVLTLSTPGEINAFYNGTIAPLQEAYAASLVFGQVGSYARDLAQLNSDGQYFQIGNDGNFYLAYTDTQISAVDLVRGKYKQRFSQSVSQNTGSPTRIKNPVDPGISYPFSKSSVLYDGFGATVTGSVKATQRLKSGNPDVNLDGKDVTFSKKILNTTFKINVTKMSISRSIQINDGLSFHQSLSRDGLGYGFTQNIDDMYLDGSIMITPKQRDLGAAAVVIGSGIVILDVATVPSGEGAVGIQMIRWGLGY